MNVNKKILYYENEKSKKAECVSFQVVILIFVLLFRHMLYASPVALLPQPAYPRRPFYLIKGVSFRIR